MVDNIIKAIGLRLRSLRETAGLSQGELALRIGVSQNMISRYERGDVDQPIITLSRIVEALNPPPEQGFAWLVSGESQPSPQTAESAAREAAEKEVREKAVRPVAAGDSVKFQEPQRNWRDAPIYLGDEQFIFVPLYDVTASLGGGADVQAEKIMGHISFSRKWIDDEGLIAPNLCAIRVEGDSMEPTLSSGDTVLVDLSVKKLRDGSMYVFQLDGLLVIKRLQFMIGGGVRIVSDNSRYSEQVVSSETAAESLKIIGRIVWVAKRV